MLPSEQSWHPVDYEIETAWLRYRTPASGPKSAGSTTGYEPDDEGWSDNLVPPTEGSLDQPTARRLVAHLANTGRSTECIAAYSFLAGGWPEDTNPCFAGSVDRLLDLCEIELGTPSNFWAMDRSWFVYTDWDLWATEVNGPPTLIAALEADAELETITWPDPDPRS